MKVIFEDTRNKPEKNAHIRKQLEDLGYKVERTKLFAGDYTFPTNQSICVDTKKNMSEIESNLIQDHERFKAECVRAKEAGIMLVILVQDKSIRRLTEVFGWTNPRVYYTRKNKRPPITGRSLAKIMITMEERYGVKFEFCDKTEVGKTIIKLLKGGNNEEV